MHIVPDGTVSLLLPPTGYINHWRQFWRRHRDLLDEANSLLIEVPDVLAMSKRLITYVSADLCWITRDSSAPIAFEALAAGLRSYRSARDAEFARRPFVTSLGPYRAFVETTLAQAAAQLSLVTLSSSNAIWSPAAGMPLRPWLAEQSAGIGVRCRPFDQNHALRVRTAMEAYVLTTNDRRIVAPNRRS